jgi:hypothetical protein
MLHISLHSAHQFRTKPSRGRGGLGLGQANKIRGPPPNIYSLRSLKDNLGQQDKLGKGLMIGDFGMCPG